MIAANTTTPDTATTLANRIIASLDMPLMIDDIEVCASGCIGIAFAPTDGADPEALLKSADEALYAAKYGIGGAIQIYNSEFFRAMPTLLCIRNAMIFLELQKFEVGPDLI